MNKNAIKKFAIEARQKLIASVTDKAGMLGITADGISAPITKGNDFEVYQTAAGTEVTLNKKQCEQRRRLAEQIETKGFEEVVEEVAYTWFNRICAIRFMEVNDYLPSRVRALSSEKEGKNEPDLVTQALDVDLDLTDAEKEFVIESKMSGKLDELFAMLFVKQCNKLHEVLPELFEETSDYTEMLLSISFTYKDDVVRMLIDEVPEEDFNITTTDENGNVPGQVEIIGWLYQYYNTELKDDTFAKLRKNIKITKERIPAATQLFTPDWIVRYMVENSVGRLWIEHLRAVDPSVDEKKTAEEFGWKYYLPEAEQEESVNQQLATIRAEYKNMTPEDIVCIDPCMGSGHILVAIFDVLMDIYKSAGYSERDAALLIVQNNIHGLDIDKRAYQLAYFAVMMKGRQYNRRFLRAGKETQNVKVYFIKESNYINRKHLQHFGIKFSNNEKNIALNQVLGLLEELRDATEYGSILNITRYDWGLLRRFVEDFQLDGQISFDTVGIENTQKKLVMLINQADVMSKKYDVVITNPPYMGNATVKLTEYIQNNYQAEKYDLYSVFIAKANNIVKSHGFTSLVTGESWMFLPSFAEMRNRLISNCLLINMAHLGSTAFEAGFGTTAFILRRVKIYDFISLFIKMNNYRIDEEVIDTVFETEKNFIIKKIDEFETIEASPFAYWMDDKIFEIFRGTNLGDVSLTKSGIVTGNNEFFMKFWHEINYQDIRFDAKTGESILPKWVPAHKGGGNNRYFGNNEYVMRLYDLWSPKYAKSNMRRGDQDYYFREGVTWSTLSNKLAFRYSPEGFVYETKGSMCFSNEKRLLKYLLAILNSSLCEYIMNILSPTLDFNRSSLMKMPYVYDEDAADELEKIVDECIEIAKEDWDSYETSWEFKKHPLI